MAIAEPHASTAIFGKDCEALEASVLRQYLVSRRIEPRKSCISEDVELLITVLDDVLDAFAGLQFLENFAFLYVPPAAQHVFVTQQKPEGTRVVVNDLYYSVATYFCGHFS